MRIGGLQKLTLIDYPGKVAATVFLIGCNFRCPYCHNPELIDPQLIERQPEIKESDFLKFLKERKGFLDGVCITGGEPTIHSDIPKFIQKIKKLGFLVKLDTNGSNPEMLENLIKNNLIDFIAMDVKTSISGYKKVGVRGITSKINKSVKIIKNSKKDYEFRTTIAPGVVDEKDIIKIGKWLKGSKKIALQQFRPEKVLDQNFQNIAPYSLQEIEKMVKILEPYIEKVELRV